MQDAENQHITPSSNVAKKDVLLLLNIIAGNFDGRYGSKHCRDGKVENVVIYAEFDRIYHFEHSRFANDCYLRRNAVTGNDECLKQEEYLTYLRSKVVAGKKADNQLKNKINNTFKLLYHIIDGIDFTTGTYREHVQVAIGAKRWKRTPEEKEHLKNAVQITYRGKGNERHIFYECKYDIDKLREYVTWHFNAKSDARCRQKISEYTSIHNKLLADNLQHFEEEIVAQNGIEASQNSQRDLTFDSNVAAKYLNTVRYALHLFPPEDVAILYLKNFASAAVGSPDPCLDHILAKTGNTYDELKALAEKYDKNERAEAQRGLEDQIELLRSKHSSSLVDVLFVYAQFCIKIREFEKAENCLKECEAIYLKRGDIVADLDWAVIYSELSRLHRAWQHADEAADKLLRAMDHDLQHLKSKGDFETVMSRREMYSDNLDKAKSFIDRGLNTYDDLCRKSCLRYEVGKLYLLITRADVYEAEGDDARAEDQYLSAKSKAEALIESGVHVAKEMLQSILLNLSLLYNKIGNFGAAIESCQQMLAVCDELVKAGNEEYYSLERSMGFDTLAIAYYNTQNVDAALDFCHKALEECKNLVESGYSRELTMMVMQKIETDLKRMSPT